jgi:hypothetical protein
MHKLIKIGKKECKNEGDKKHNLFQIETDELPHPQ